MIDEAEASPQFVAEMGDEDGRDNGVKLGPGAAAMATTQVSLEKYLRTDYEPDCATRARKSTRWCKPSASSGWQGTKSNGRLEAYPEVRMGVADQSVNC